MIATGLIFTALLLIITLDNTSADTTLSMTFGVGLTTIPPRFPTVHHVIASWLVQQSPPAVIVVFVPQRYQNFMSESPRNKNMNIISLSEELAKHYPEEISNGKIVVQALSKDWGPMSKYMGLLDHFEEYSNRFNIDYWVIGDDDVRYSDNTLSDYAAAIVRDKSVMSVSTHFKVHPRVQVNMGASIVSINHLQGVDTVLFPTALLRSGRDSARGLTLPVLMEGVRLFHQMCPDSFYQDDYIMSFLVAMSGVDVKSIWSGQKVAHHVNSVSKSNQQMHIHPQVFQREDNTKKCIAEYGLQISAAMEKKRLEYDREL